MPKLRVLVVDDNRNTLLIMERLLSRFDCEIRACQESKNAVETAKDFQPHTIFLDIDMPIPDGYEVAEDLHELQLPEYTLVALTSYTDEEHRRECATSGFDIFLAKPVSIDDVAKVIETAKERFSRAENPSTAQ